MTQSSFIFPRDSHVLDVREQRRLTGQSLRILERLRQGPATNRELAAISLKYTSRNSDLRKAGYDVQVIEHDRKTGLAVYALVNA
jgi:guanylate kinase